MIYEKKTSNQNKDMWYLVNLPGNKLNVAVKTEKNSIAADCLNKVSVQCDIMRTVDEIFSELQKKTNLF